MIFAEKMDACNAYDQIPRLVGSYEIFIIDRYLEDKWPNSCIPKFLEELKSRLNVVKGIYWFCEKEYLCNECDYDNLTAIDINKLGRKFHDRFLFVYDTECKTFVDRLHIGCSINGINADIFQVFRISRIDPEDEDSNWLEETIIGVSR